jgi:hypothetical protein
VVLTAFLVGLAFSLVALAFVAVRGLALWRQVKRTGSAFTEQAAAFEERTARTERLLAENERASASSRPRSSVCGCRERGSGC